MAQVVEGESCFDPCALDGRLRDSDIATKAKGDEFRCAVLLWCAAWHQVPAARPCTPALLPPVLPKDVISQRLAEIEDFCKKFGKRKASDNVEAK